MSNRDKDNGEAMVFAIIMIAILAIAAAFYLAALALTVFYTCLCIAAWNEPQQFKDHTIFPNEARSFVLSGLAMMVFTLIVFVIGVEADHWKIKKEAWWFIAITAYMVGSLGFAALDAPKNAEGEPDLFPKRHIPLPITPPPPRPIIDVTATTIEPDSKQPPFAFADWDDDEVRS